MKSNLKKQIIIYITSIMGLILLMSSIISISFYFTSPKIMDVILSQEVNENRTKTLSINFFVFNNRNIYCQYINGTGEASDWLKADGRACTLEVTSNDYQINIRYHGNRIKKLSDNFNVDQVYYLNVISKRYLAIGQSFELRTEIAAFGNPNLDINFKISDDSIINIENNRIIGKSPGKALVTAQSSTGLEHSFEVVVTELIKNMQVNNRRSLVPCNRYSLEDSELLDAIVEDIVRVSGYASRGAVVNLSRFMPLQMTYRVPYFFENGRLTVFEPNRNILDGEGRYYHRGLFLHESKIQGLNQNKIGWGPAIWGCGLTNWDDSYGWRRGVKYPNGLSCSGFVTWVLLNAGFDPGDIGAGFSPHPNLADLGPRIPLTHEWANAPGNLKVGDLIGMWGHIAIISGINDGYIYIAESWLDGVVMERFSITDRNSRLYRLYAYVVDMEEFYQEGNGEGVFDPFW